MITHLNVGCGPHRAPPPWWNIDLAPEVEPDQVVTMYDPLPFEHDTLQRIYLGHVLEHIPWLEVEHYARWVLERLEPGGQACVVGPDTYRTIRLWAECAVTWEQVTSVLEHDEGRPDLGDWPEARHSWNCHEDRVARLMEAVGFEVERVDVSDKDRLAEWPVVSHAAWQCAVIGTRP